MSEVSDSNLHNNAVESLSLRVLGRGVSRHSGHLQLRSTPTGCIGDARQIVERLAGRSASRVAWLVRDAGILEVTTGKVDGPNSRKMSGAAGSSNEPGRDESSGLTLTTFCRSRGLAGTLVANRASQRSCLGSVFGRSANAGRCRSGVARGFALSASCFPLLTRTVFGLRRRRSCSSR